MAFERGKQRTKFTYTLSSCEQPGSMCVLSTSDLCTRESKDAPRVERKLYGIRELIMSDTNNT